MHQDNPDYYAQFKVYESSFQDISGEDNLDNTANEENGQRYIRKEFKEIPIPGGSFHYFNGRIWDKWRMAGINSMFIDGEYVWFTSTIRVRRLLVPR